MAVTCKVAMGDLQLFWLFLQGGRLLLRRITLTPVISSPSSRPSQTFSQPPAWTQSTPTKLLLVDDCFGREHEVCD